MLTTCTIHVLYITCHHYIIWKSVLWALNRKSIANALTFSLLTCFQPFSKFEKITPLQNIIIDRLMLEQREWKLSTSRINILPPLLITPDLGKILLKKYFKTKTQYASQIWFSNTHTTNTSGKIMNTKYKICICTTQVCSNYYW